MFRDFTCTGIIGITWTAKFGFEMKELVGLDLVIATAFGELEIITLFSLLLDRTVTSLTLSLNIQNDIQATSDK